MKLKVYFGKAKTILLIAVAALALGAFIVNLLFLKGVGKMVTNVPVAAGLSLGFSALIVAFAATIFFNSNYKFEETEFVSTVSFFKDKIDYAAIAEIKENSDTRALYVVFKYDTKKAQGQTGAVRILIKPDENQKVIDFIKQKNPEVLYDTFTSPQKEQK